MKESYEYYKTKVSTGKQIKDVLEEARQDYGIKPNYNITSASKYGDTDIPFNLEREYVFDLIANKQYEEAKKWLENMKISYLGAISENLIESYEQYLIVTINTDSNIKLSLNEAKKEFNQHTITLISVVVGVVTLLGTANQVFRVNDFRQAILTFATITMSITFLIVITFGINNFNRK